MVLTPLYLGENKREGYFNLPSKKKSNNLIKDQEKKTLADLVVESALNKLNEKDKTPKK